MNISGVKQMYKGSLKKMWLSKYKRSTFSLSKIYPMTTSSIMPLIDNVNPRAKYASCDLYKAINPILFDVTLRDGIQNADPSKWTTDRKRDFLDFISSSERPPKMEVGSLVSSKVLPILHDSLQLYNHSIKTLTATHGTEIYMLIPSLNRLYSAMTHNILNMSFITSVSNSFQKKNTKRTLDETKEELSKINIIINSAYNIRKKLYISCITECPIDGKQDIEYVLKEILWYHTNYEFDELCLSDTCGTMSFDDFEYLIDNLIQLGVPPSKISLHLHVSASRVDELYRIIWYSFDKKVNKFDVSMLETGGCSVTMRSDKMLPNLSYDLFYRILDRYIAYHTSA